MFKYISICWVTESVSKHQAVAVLNLSPALWPDEYFIMLYQEKQLLAQGPGLLSLSFPRIHHSLLIRAPTPEKRAGLLWQKRAWMTLPMLCYRGRCFFYLIFQPCLAGARSQLCRRRSLNNMDREHKINTL